MTDPVVLAPHGDGGSTDPADASPALLEAIAQASKHGLLVMDLAGTVLYASASSSWLVGLTPEQVVGTSIFDYVEPEEAGYALEAMANELAHPSLNFHPSDVHLNGPTGRLLVEVRGHTRDRGQKGTEIILFLKQAGTRAAVYDVLSSVMRYEPVGVTLQVVVALALEQIELIGAAVTHASLDGGIAVVAQGVDPDAVRALADGREAAPVPGGVPPSVRRVPLTTSRGQVVGDLTLWSAPGVPTAPSDQLCIERLARLATFAIDRSHRDSELAHAAEHDPLTETLNRSAFIAQLEDARRTKAAARPAVLFVDLDGFKRVNDEHGHNVGDEVLITVARRMSRALREDDLVARLGGDEFAVLCDAVTDRAAVLAIADRLVESVRRPIRIGELVVHVGASVGIAFDGDRGVGADDLLGRADAALYRAKRSGKGCWRIADDETTPAVSDG